MKNRDYSLAPSDDGMRAVLHRADCPKVRRQAARGDMVMTMLQCEEEPDDLELERYDCLTASGADPA